ncbi:hypothetical protein K678_03432 [Magnetospirillum fulvum MGU-K5]|uniref:Uncharacterized protein n=2 Tax=Magnetospirillum fulvum TaxID=1082 RepID=S9TKZ2_MAGFU|nr:hypothetical protein K678_03432 [Magnetospirillum fulvum MGU-K5]
MPIFNLPSSCQQKFTATSNCLKCGIVVDALVILGDIAYCPIDRTCTHSKECAEEAAHCAEGLPQGNRLKSRLLGRLDSLPIPLPSDT